MKDYRYIFDGPYLTCPHCGRDGKYRNIYDMATGQPVADGECGACFVCDFDVNAYQYFKEHPEAKTDGIPYTPPPVKPVSYIPENELTSYLIDTPLKGKANLTDYLLHMMDESDLMPVLAKYGVGADGYGAMVWPQIDICHQIREIKVQWHNPSNGSRKGGYTYLGSPA